MMEICTVCKKKYDPDQVVKEPAVEMGTFLGDNVLKDGEKLCPTCLSSRGILGMMYCRNMD